MPQRKNCCFAVSDKCKSMLICSGLIWFVLCACVGTVIAVLSCWSWWSQPCDPRLYELTLDDRANETFRINPGCSHSDSAAECCKMCKFYNLRLDMHRGKTLGPLLKNFKYRIEAASLNPLCFLPQHELSLTASDVDYGVEQSLFVQLRSLRLKDASRSSFIYALCHVFPILTLLIYVKNTNKEKNNTGQVLLFCMLSILEIGISYWRGLTVLEKTSCEHGVSMYNRNGTFPNDGVEYFCDSKDWSSTDGATRNIKLPDQDTPTSMEVFKVGQILKIVNMCLLSMGFTYWIIAMLIVFSGQARERPPAGKVQT